MEASAYIQDHDSEVNAIALHFDNMLPPDHNFLLIHFSGHGHLHHLKQEAFLSRQPIKGEDVMHEYSQAETYMNDDM